MIEGLSELGLRVTIVLLGLAVAALIASATIYAFGYGSIGGGIAGSILTLALLLSLIRVAVE